MDLNTHAAALSSLTMRPPGFDLPNPASLILPWPRCHADYPLAPCTLPPVPPQRLHLLPPSPAAVLASPGQLLCFASGCAWPPVSKLNDLAIAVASSLSPRLPPTTCQPRVPYPTPASVSRPKLALNMTSHHRTPPTHNPTCKQPWCGVLAAVLASTPSHPLTPAEVDSSDPKDSKGRSGIGLAGTQGQRWAFLGLSCPICR